MSSIVKAKHLTEVHMSYGSSENKRQSVRPAEQVIEMEDQMMFDEKKEDIIRQTMKKSRHIEDEAIKRADELIEDALSQSKEIIVNAEKKGYDEGYLRGLIDGADASSHVAQDGLDEIKRLIGLIKKHEQHAVKKEEKQLLAISFELAKKIMKHAIEVDETLIEKMLEEIVSENEGKIKILISEYQKTLDIHVNKSLVKKIKHFSKDAKVIFVQEDDRILVETEGGVIDMSIPAQLEQLKKAVDNSI